MNMAHPALVRTLMEEVETHRLHRATVEYWTDVVGEKRHLVEVEVMVLETEEVKKDE